ncbi:Protein of unknown function [Prosthecobacter debontii]|uniref:DUF3307 domain-containing protein n=1 Tax=Prosthecobacter debontii TaxID=48467 RepID=A0A1T4XI57_9BACT|nr:DUF3307 domain-containing protein [Prosthecobacter debontii]SKA88785.1 Protein of unknown function [Prosthecobacter debontii]
MIQLILHLFGDYVTQSDWMAQNKTKSTWAAFCHALVYSLPFALIASLPAWLVIFSTHLLIDRYHVARFVVYLKNIIFSPAGCLWWYSTEVRRTAMDKLHWCDCSGTGYHKDAPPWLAVWLLIAADNTLHLAINYASIRWL